MSARVSSISPVKLAAILALTFLVLAGATWVTLIIPKQSKESSLSTTIKSAQTQLTKLTNNARTAHQHAVSQSLLLTRALPNDVGMPQIVLQLSRVATEEHVSLDAITPASPISYSGYQALPMTIIVSGDYFGIQGFLQQIRDQVQVSDGSVTATGRLYDVLSVSMLAVTPAPKVSATITLDAFSYTGIAVAPSGGTTTTTTG